MTTSALTLALLLLGIGLPQDANHQHDEMTRRGDAVMGFSHEKTTHHFRLRAEGGEIEATAIDSRDADSIAQIRGHFRHIARMFGDGNFTAPTLIHAQNPPGVQAMAARNGEITYALEMLPAGARIRITTGDQEALEAIHSFLRFQITDHRTGDPLTIQK
jgi:hypothetical protein